MAKGAERKVLLVDDEEDIIDMLRYNLEREGFRVSSASNGTDALRLARTELPDLIVLDIMMPGMDGVETCSELRTLPELKQTMIIFLSAREEDYTQIACFNAGADDYIIKPVRPGVFVSKVKALMKRSRLMPSDVRFINSNGISIDTERMAVLRGTEQLHLPKKQFELLALLMGNPGKVFRREEIFTRIWGGGPIVGDRTIDVHIRKLREKLGGDHIGTVKGIGYKFLA